MASRASFPDDSRIIKRPLPKSLLLKDYLLDDLSSCSSNGFRSYPRRQCCTTVRFLIEIDLNKHKHVKLQSSQKNQPPALKTKLKSKSAPSSVLHRASAAVVNAFKQLPFVHSTAGGKARRANFLPRSLSRKLLKHGLWKKTTDHQNKKEIKRLKSFGEQKEEKEENMQPPRSGFSTIVKITTSTAAEQNSSTSNSNSNSNSWSDSDFTTTSGSFTTGNSEVHATENDGADSKLNAPEKKKTTNGKGVGVTTAVTATNYSAADQTAKKEWQNEEKEQCSPVSVMDFPCDGDVDDEDEVSCPFQHRLLRVEGTKRKLKHKIQLLENLIQIEPVKLEDRIALSECDSSGSLLESLRQPSLALAQEEIQTDKKAMALLQLMKATVSSQDLFKSKAVENLLLGFFSEKIVADNEPNYNVLQVAKDWVNGRPKEMLLDWVAQENRLAYIRDMEKGTKWSKYDNEVQKGEVGLELEHEVFASLIDEILLDFH